MASKAEYAYAKNKYKANSKQANLLAQVDEHSQLQAKLKRSIAMQQALEAELSELQAANENKIAQEQLHYAQTDFEEKKMGILLQGFDAISGIMKNITSTSSLIMGFTATVIVKQDVNQVSTPIKLSMWTFCLVTIVMLLHAVFVATLTVTDGTKLAYQGTHGYADVQRAFHGIMAQRSQVVWHFVAGFAAFNFLVVLLVWCKLDQDAGSINVFDTNLEWVFGVAVSIFAWLVPVMRMLKASANTRSLFRIDKSEDHVKRTSSANDDFALQVGPQSIRKKLLGTEDDILRRSSATQMTAINNAGTRSPIANTIEPDVLKLDVRTSSASSVASSIGIGGVDENEKMRRRTDKYVKVASSLGTKLRTSVRSMVKNDRAGKKGSSAR